MKIFEKVILIVGIFFSNVAICQNFSLIPTDTILLNKILGKENDRYYGSIKNINQKLKVEAFAISQQIKFAEYKTYLEFVKKDSSFDFYKTQLPDSSITTKKNYLKYTTDKLYEDFAVAGISWNAAMQFCKWKTLNDADSGIYIYRLPKLSEWLAANNYLSINKLPNDFSKNFSDWTLSTYYENIINSHSKDDNTFSFDLAIFSSQNNNPSMQRKVTIGDSYLYQGTYLSNHLRGRFSYAGFREVSFRIVKEKMTNKASFNLNRQILDYWDIDSLKFINTKTIL